MNYRPTVTLTLSDENFARIDVNACPWHPPWEHELDPCLVITFTNFEGKGPPDREGANHIACGNCGCTGPWGRTEREAVERWNLWCSDWGPIPPEIDYQLRAKHAASS